MGTGSDGKGKQLDLDDSFNKEIEDSLKKLPTDSGQAYALEKKSLQMDALKEKLEGLIQDRTERKEVGRKLIRLVNWWLLGVFVLLFCHGIGSQPDGSQIPKFEIPEAVLNTLLVTTTANLIGLLYVIAKYLYHEKRIDPDAKDDAPTPPVS